jgi:hypothetical protein
MGEVPAAPTRPLTARPPPRSLFGVREPSERKAKEASQIWLSSQVNYGSLGLAVSTGIRLPAGLSVRSPVLCGSVVTQRNSLRVLVLTRLVSTQTNDEQQCDKQGG